MGLLHIYCGDGKGKTTAAVGLAIRASGAGMRVHIIQLLKGGETSELGSLSRIDGIRVSRLSEECGFTFNMSGEERAKVTAEHNKLLADAISQLSETDMLIIDEFFAADNSGLIDQKLADSIIFGDRSSFELVLTGRDPDVRYIEAAICNIKKLLFLQQLFDFCEEL